MKFRAVSIDYLDEEIVMEIRSWRNQEFVRKMMNHSHIITEDEHNRYIEKLKQDKNRNILVFFLDDEAFEVMQYEIDIDENNASFVFIGNYLTSQKYQDLGFGSIGNYMINRIIRELLNVDLIKYEILETNRKNLNNALKNNQPIYVDKVIDEINNKAIKRYHFCEKINTKLPPTKLEKLVTHFIDIEDINDMVKI